MSCAAFLVPTQPVTGFRWELPFCIIVQAGEMVMGHRAGPDSRASFPRKPSFQGPWCLPSHPCGLSSLPRQQEVCKSLRTGLTQARCSSHCQVLDSSVGVCAVELPPFRFS